MAGSCGSGVVKLLLCIINFAFLVLGCAICYMGYTLIDWSNQVHDLTQIDYKAVSWVILITGVAILLVAALGFFGACCESSFMLNAYAFALVVLVAVEIFFVVKALQQNKDIEEEFGKKMMEAIEQIKTDAKAAEVLQKFQTFGKCCGWNGPGDYSDKPLKSCCGGGGKGNETCDIKDVIYKGCKEKLNNLFGPSSSVGIALILIQLILVFAGCCLARDFR